MNERKLHDVLPRPHEYEITDFRCRVDRLDPAQSFIDLTLEKAGDVVALRFWQPQRLRIEEGFPLPTGGIVFCDVSSDSLEGIGVEVGDFEASGGSVSLVARKVERLSADGG